MITLSYVCTYKHKWSINVKRIVIRAFFITFVILVGGCGSTGRNEKAGELSSKIKNDKMMEHLTKESFLKKVFNFEQNKDWKYEGDLPCLIDFYADWCGPCKMVAPVLEELAKEYEGKILIYKVDTEAEPELAGAFGIRSIPSLLFCPMDSQPQMAMGALPKSTLKKAIDEVLLASKIEVK